MRPFYSVLLVFTLVVAGVVWYGRASTVCPIPLPYRLGVYDERFLLSRDEVVSVLKEAEKAWEEATGRDLFVYDAEATFVVDFVFDARQAEALTEAKLRAALDQKELASNETLLAIAALNEEYEALRARHERQVAAYEGRLERYNSKVAAVNAAGGARPDEFASLTKEEEELRLEGVVIEAMTGDLNELVSRINNVGEYGNRLIDEYNRGVQNYNQRFAETGAFTQGEYAGDRIVIYKYTDRTELLKVVAHEFGHALGIGHVEGSEAIMYYLLEEQPHELTLAPEDIAAFTAVCGERDGWSHALRNLIRRGIALII